MKDDVNYYVSQSGRLTPCPFCKAYKGFLEADSRRNKKYYVTRKVYRVVLRKLEIRPDESKPFIDIAYNREFFLHYCPTCGAKLKVPRIPRKKLTPYRSVFSTEHPILNDEKKIKK